MTAVPEITVVEEIPDSMKKLASFIARGFYSKEHGIIIDMLKRNVCMKEDHLRDITKFDIRQLRSILISLKQDKLIKERQLVEERPESNRPLKINYYFINYRALLNVTKYKIDHMRRKLESEEMTNTHRAAYKCSKCQKPYTDLDVGHLFDFETQSMRCLFCSGDVEEDASAGPSKDTRSLLAKFNEQMCPLFLLLQELDGIQLAPHLLEPTPCGDGSAASADTLGQSTKFGSGLAGRPSSQRVEFGLYQQQGLTVNIEGSESATTVSRDTVPEVPLWLRESTVPYLSSNEATSKASETSEQPSAPGGVSPTKEVAQSEIVETLLAHEAGEQKRSERKDEEVSEEMKREESRSSDSEFEDVEEGDEETVVFVQGAKYELSKVSANPALVQQMTAEEKEQYISISQQHVFD